MPFTQIEVECTWFMIKKKREKKRTVSRWLRRFLVYGIDLILGCDKSVFKDNKYCSQWRLTTTKSIKNCHFFLFFSVISITLFSIFFRQFCIKYRKRFGIDHKGIYFSLTKSDPEIQFYHRKFKFKLDSLKFNE